MCATILIQLTSGKSIQAKTSKRVATSWKLLQDKLDRLYFDNLPNYYPAAVATVTVNRVPTTYFRTSNSNAAGQWHKSQIKVSCDVCETD